MSLQKLRLIRDLSLAQAAYAESMYKAEQQRQDALQTEKNAEVQKKRIEELQKQMTDLEGLEG